MGLSVGIRGEAAPGQRELLEADDKSRSLLDLLGEAPKAVASGEQEQSLEEREARRGQCGQDRGPGEGRAAQR